MKIFYSPSVWCPHEGSRSRWHCWCHLTCQEGILWVQSRCERALAAEQINTRFWGCVKQCGVSRISARCNVIVMSSATQCIYRLLNWAYTYHTLKYLRYCDDVRYWLKTLCAKCVANVCDNMADRDIALPFNGILFSTELYCNLQLRWEDTGERGESVGFGLCVLLPFRSHSYLWWNLYFV